MKGMTILQKLHILRPPRPNVEWDHALPVETLEKIFGYLADERDKHGTRVAFIRETFQPMMRRISLVCRAWYTVANKSLYSEIYLSSSKAMELLADALGKNKQLRPYVRQFYFTSKTYVSGNPQMMYTLMDLHNVTRIHELCPNLMLVSRGKPFRKYPFEKDDDSEIRALSLKRADIGTLTYLYISLPNRAMFGGKMMFSSNIEFPSLQTLYIVCSWRTYEDEETDEFEPQWFRMPQLRRLTLQDFYVKPSQKLTFPNSPYLHTIDILRGDLRSVENFFDPRKGPLAPFKKTLQSLTITARQVGNPYSLPSFDRWAHILTTYGEDSDPWFLEFLENLTELCLPFKSFSRKGIATYPPHLKEFALVGYHWKHFDETFTVREDGFRRLNKLFINLRVGNGERPRELKRVRVLLRNAGTWSTKDGNIAPPKQVDLKMGFERYRFRHMGLDYVDIGLKNLQLK